MHLITALSITSLNGGTITFDGANYILTEVSGLESPTVRLSRYNLPGSSGAYISNALYGERAIKLRGVVNAPDYRRTTYLANRVALINALAFQTDDTGVLQPQTLTLTLESGLILQTNVYVDTPLQLGFSPEQPEYEDFQVSFVAADPFLYATIAIATTISLPIGGGSAIPTAIPISLAPSSGGRAVITNPGSVPSTPVITLSAPLTNPYITNLRTNKFLAISATLAVGDDPLVIDCGAQTITQGANTVTGIQSQDSTFWSILAGDNTLGFSAAAGTGTAQVVLLPSYLGV
jgi:hypothetical protein